MSAPAVQNPAPSSVAQLLKVLTPELARAVPRGMDADRIVRLVTTEVRKSRNAKAAGIAKQSLEDCTQESFAGALLTASALGLEPGVNGECYLVPYRDNRRRVVECQLIIGYQGIVKLFWQHPRAARIDAQWVGENDEFRYTMGLNPTLEHVKALGDRGRPIYYYAVVEVTGAQPLWDVFTADEIKELRRGKVGSSGDIKDPQHWMERKTALKQVLKLAPKTTRLDAAIKSDDRPGTDLSRSQALELPPLPPSVQTTPSYIEGEVGDQDAIEPAPDVAYISTDQIAELGKLFAAQKIDDEPTQLDWLAQAVDHPVDRISDLTAAEAAQVFEILSAK